MEDEIYKRTGMPTVEDKNFLRAPTGEEKIKAIEEDPFWYPDGTKVKYTSPYYPDIWVSGIIGEDVFLKGTMNSGHGMNWDAEKHFFKDRKLVNIKYGKE